MTGMQLMDCSFNSNQVTQHRWDSSLQIQQFMRTVLNIHVHLKSTTYPSERISPFVLGWIYLKTKTPMAPSSSILQSAPDSHLNYPLFIRRKEII